MCVPMSHPGLHMGRYRTENSVRSKHMCQPLPVPISFYSYLGRSDLQMKQDVLNEKETSWSYGSISKLMQASVLASLLPHLLGSC